MRTHNINLKNFICITPFYELEIHRDRVFYCCPAYLQDYETLIDNNIDKVWNSESATIIRNSILDGSYKYCNKQACPYLSKLLNSGIPNGTIYSKNNISPYNKIINNTLSPKLITLNIDRSCNFKCPSCRKELIYSNNEEYLSNKKLLSEIENSFSENLETICISGSGEPFSSKVYKEYLRSFNPKRYKKLKNIHIITNGSLWTEKMWNSMPNIHPYVKTCEISIDAGTKETYENIVRINGDWERLMENIEFIKTIDTIEEIRASFLVQSANYKEMLIFSDLMYKKLGNKVAITFIKINNWGTFSDEEFSKVKIYDKNHPEHELFIEEFNKIHNRPRVRHNLHEFVRKTKTEKKYLI